MHVEALTDANLRHVVGLTDACGSIDRCQLAPRGRTDRCLLHVVGLTDAYFT